MLIIKQIPSRQFVANALVPTAPYQHMLSIYIFHIAFDLNWVKYMLNYDWLKYTHKDFTIIILIL